MEMSGEQLIPASQQETWEALNDPQVLKACVPGCEAIDHIADNEYQVRMVARVGPVSAKFKGRLTISDVRPPESYAIAFEGQGGAAGFAKGGARVKLIAQDAQSTRLTYDVKASVGGKLAQIGSRLVDAAAKKVADDFFRNFTEKLSAGAQDDTVVPGKGGHKTNGGKQAAPSADEDDGLPRLSDTTLRIFAGGALVVFFGALVAFLG